MRHLPAYNMALVVTVVPLIDNLYAAYVLPKVDCSMPNIAAVAVECRNGRSGRYGCVSLNPNAGTSCFRKRGSGCFLDQRNTLATPNLGSPDPLSWIGIEVSASS